MYLSISSFSRAFGYIMVGDYVLTVSRLTNLRPLIANKSAGKSSLEKGNLGSGMQKFFYLEFIRSVRLCDRSKGPNRKSPHSRLLESTLPVNENQIPHSIRNPEFRLLESTSPNAEIKNLDCWNPLHQLVEFRIQTNGICFTS